VPLATTTGWNFRDPSVGNPQDIYQLQGSYIPFARTNASRQANADPRASLEERYRGIDDYLQRIRGSAMELIRRRYLLAEDLDRIVERAKRHWASRFGRTIGSLPIVDDDNAVRVFPDDSVVARELGQRLPYSVNT
jgi:hypothetical protein